MTLKLDRRRVSTLFQRRVSITSFRRRLPCVIAVVRYRTVDSQQPGVRKSPMVSLLGPIVWQQPEGNGPLLTGCHINTLCFAICY